MFRFLLLVFYLNYGSADFPTNKINPCRFGDTECVKANTQHIQSQYSSGIRELNLLSVDPLKIASLDIVQGGTGPVSIKLNLRNAEFRGLAKSSIRSVKGFGQNFDGQTFEMQTYLPRGELAGDYKINGKILFLPIQGEGKASIILDQAEIALKMKVKSVIKNGREYMEVVQTKLKLVPQKMYFNFQRLFGGDKALGDGTNAFVNENWREVYAELQPLIEDAFARICKDVLNRVFSKTPYTDLFQPA